MIWKAFIVFSAMFALDFVWAKYTVSITLSRATMAGVYASIIIVLAGIAQIGYTSDNWLLIPAAFGAFFGAAAAVMASR